MRYVCVGGTGTNGRLYYFTTVILLTHCIAMVRIIESFIHSKRFPAPAILANLLTVQYNVVTPL